MALKKNAGTRAAINQKPTEKKFQTGAERVRAGQPTATDEVVTTIRQWLIAGKIVPGQRMTEADLSRDLGVSKGPVREAMQRLAADGIVRLAPYKGYLVYKMSRGEVSDVFDVLEVMDGLCARKAAERVKDGASTDALKEGLRIFEESHFELSRMRATGNEEQLNNALIVLSGNDTIRLALERIQYSIFPLQFRALQLRGVPEHLLELVRKFMTSVLEGNPKAAETGAKAHANALREHILSLPDDWFQKETDDG
jgi:DNA-binding GntR family transcriptional regulator